MMPDAPTTVLTLTESQAAYFPAAALSPDLEAWLGRRFGQVLEVQPPSFQTDGRWRLFSRGWVGAIPLPDQRLIHLQPRFPIANLFEMIAAVYEVAPLRWLPGSFRGEEIRAFYEFLAQALLTGVQQRLRRGIFRGYETVEGRLPAVRGRLDMARMSQVPTRVDPYCIYHTHSADNPHNQLLAWTLLRLSQTGLASEPIRREARFLGRRLPVTLRPFQTAEIEQLTYSRLNDDYRRLHQLCRFFLDQIGPTHQLGERDLTPFLIDMPRLFERFVARWLADHLPAGWRVAAQAPIPLDLGDGRGGQSRRLLADLLLYDERGQLAAVLDTKYKDGLLGDLTDVYQITFYAHELGCSRAFLVYPALPDGLPQGVRGHNRGVDYQALVFNLGGKLETAGARFLQELGLSGLDEG